MSELCETCEALDHEYDVALLACVNSFNGIRHCFRTFGGEFVYDDALLVKAMEDERATPEDFQVEISWLPGGVTAKFPASISGSLLVCELKMAGQHSDARALLTEMAWTFLEACRSGAVMVEET